MLHNKFGALFGRIICFIIFCAPLLVMNTFSKYYECLIAKEVTIQFLEEIHENELTESAYLSLLGEVSPLGFQVQLSLEGRDRTFTNDELLDYIHTQSLVLKKNEYVTCTLYNKDRVVLRVGGSG